MERTLGAAFASGTNAFDLMRLGAALLVLFSHAFVLTGHAGQEPVAILLRHLADGGSLAVAMFFILSGFLIARSAQRHGVGAYARARFLRIYPAFLVVVLLQALLLGPAMTGLPLRDYWAACWPGLLRALLFSPPATLPGVFGGNPLPEVNGSLWTLRIEVLCYAGTAAWAALRLGAAGWAAALLLGVAALTAATVLHQPAAVLALAEAGTSFAGGALLWCWRDRVRLLPWLAILLPAGAVALSGTVLALPAWHLVLPYAVLVLGLGTPALARIRLRADLSYGVYLFAFPVQQTTVSLLPGIGPWHLAALSLPPTLLLAAASHRWVEAPALRLRRPVTQTSCIPGPRQR